MKISVEPGEGFAFDLAEGTSEKVKVVRVEWQERPGAKREHVNIIGDASEPADILRAAAAYFAGDS